MGRFRIFVKELINSGSEVSSKRVAGLYMAFLFGLIVFVMAIAGDYSLVGEMGKISAVLLGATVFDSMFRKR